MRDGLNAVGSGYFWQDVLNYPRLYMYDNGYLNKNIIKGDLK
jgi:hypothetical protein